MPDWAARDLRSLRKVSSYTLWWPHQTSDLGKHRQRRSFVRSRGKVQERYLYFIDYWKHENMPKIVFSISVRPPYAMCGRPHFLFQECSFSCKHSATKHYCHTYNNCLASPLVFGAKKTLKHCTTWNGMRSASAKDLDLGSHNIWQFRRVAEWRVIMWGGS